MRYRIVRDYYRRRHFDFYRKYRHPFYAATLHFEIGRVKEFAEGRGYPIYINLCYLFTKAIQELEDFRYRFLEGEIVLYETLHVGVTVPAPGGLFSFAHLDYHPEIDAFNRSANAFLERAGREVTLREMEHTNYIYFTALPGVPFTGFTHAADDPTDGAPRVAFGRFRRDGERLEVPTGIQVNHLFIDGAALGKLAERVQRQYDEPA